MKNSLKIKVQETRNLAIANTEGGHAPVIPKVWDMISTLL